MRFSERYGYVKPSDVLIREKLTREIENAICTVYDELQNELFDMDTPDAYEKMEEYLWCYFLNNRKMDFWGGYSSRKVVATKFVLDNNR